MNNNINIFSLKIFNSGSFIFEICYINSKFNCYINYFDTHNNNLFNKKISKIGIINNRFNNYKNKFIKILV